MIKKLYISILRYVFKILPLSKFYKFKTFLLKLQKIEVSNSARLFSSVEIYGPNKIKIGNDTFIGHNTLINGSYNSKVIIGSYVDISHRVTISTGTHEIDMIGNHTAGEGFYKDIIINDGVWIVMNSIILPRVTIGKKAVVAAGSVVTKNVPDYCIVAGNPATIKKIYNSKSNKWEKYV